MTDLRFLDPNGLVNRESFNERFGLLNNLMNHIGDEYLWEKRDTENQLVGYVNSSDPNAYPPAVDDGFAYNRLGRLGGFAKIATGSYVGTGTYGANNDMSLSFDFAPKYVAILDRIGASTPDRGPVSNFGTTSAHNQLLTEGLTTSYRWYAGFSNNPSDTSYGKKSEDGKTIYWYNTNNAIAMYNNLGDTYYYLAIG